MGIRECGRGEPQRLRESAFTSHPIPDPRSPPLVDTARFAAYVQVESTNDGPIRILLD